MPEDIEREWLLEDHDPSAGMIAFMNGNSQNLMTNVLRIKPEGMKGQKMDPEGSKNEPTGAKREPKRDPKSMIFEGFLDHSCDESPMDFHSILMNFRWSLNEFSMDFHRISDGRGRGFHSHGTGTRNEKQRYLRNRYNTTGHPIDYKRTVSDTHISLPPKA